MVKADYKTIYLSDAAYQGLGQRALEAQWIRNLGRAKGMGPFLTQLLAINPQPTDWTDTRPEYLQESSLEDLEHGRFPTWDDGDYRRPRVLLFPLTSRKATSQLALSLGIVRVHPNISPGRRLGETSLTSQFWEAVGLHFLTPTNLFPTPPVKQNPRKKEFQLEW